MLSATLPRASALLGLTLACLAAGAAAADTLTLPAEAPSERTVALQEVWRLGGDDENDPLMGLVAAGAVDDQGDVYLVDRQLAHVLVIGPDGGLKATLGREGEGPGELRSPHGVFVTADGIGVVQGFPGKVIYLAADGTPAGEAVISDGAEGGFRFVRAIQPAGDRLVAASGRSVFDMEKGTSAMTSSLSVLDHDGKVLASFAEHRVEQNFQKFEFVEAANWGEELAWCVAPDGRIWSTAARDRWALNVRDLQGNLQQVIEQPFTPRKRTAEDKAAVGSDMRIVMNGRRILPEVTALDTDAAIDDLRAGADGRIYVATCWDTRARLEPGTAGRWDVLGPDGSYLEKLTVTFPDFDPDADALMWLDGTRFLVVRNFDSALAATDAGDGDGGDETEAAAADAEPLEVVLVRLPS